MPTTICAMEPGPRVTSSFMILLAIGYTNMLVPRVQMWRVLTVSSLFNYQVAELWRAQEEPVESSMRQPLGGALWLRPLGPHVWRAHSH